ncbi:MAG: type II toxin-antitoxin system VapC family toxin [SAR324 cluster bacterium]|nr:type II toxin-antitoxin system VapC family toxin [SAR324 cluster bacterium]
MILIDTDVLIDLALDRDPHAGPASELIDYLEIRRRRAFVAWHTLSNFYYLVSPTRGRKSTREFLVGLTRFLTVARTVGADPPLALQIYTLLVEPPCQQHQAIEVDRLVRVQFGIERLVHFALGVEDREILHPRSDFDGFTWHVRPSVQFRMFRGDR